MIYFLKLYFKKVMINKLNFSNITQFILSLLKFKYLLRILNVMVTFIKNAEKLRLIRIID